jgi:hypothetical protein
MQDRVGEALAVVDAFAAVVDAIHGLYLDATFAMGEMVRSYMNMDLKRLQALHRDGGLTPTTFNPVFTYRGSVKGESADLHATSLHDLVRRNVPNGSNWVFLGNTCIVAIYQFWEDSYRSLLAKALQLPRNAITADVFGELRHLRRSIIHNGGNALPEVERNRILKRFAPGDVISFAPQDMHDLVHDVELAVRDLVEARRRRADSNDVDP